MHKGFQVVKQVMPTLKIEENINGVKWLRPLVSMQRLRKENPGRLKHSGATVCKTLLQKETNKNLERYTGECRAS